MGRPGVLQYMGSQGVEHDLVMKQQFNNADLYTLKRVKILNLKSNLFYYHSNLNFF